MHALGGADYDHAGVRGGKPCIRGTRITVYDILEYLAGGMTEVEILGDFPSLTREDIGAALSFAAARGRRLAYRLSLLFDENLSPRLSVDSKPRVPGPNYS